MGNRHQPVGFPHSDIHGSSLTYSSPRHFVVCHVLLRLLVPRHPPCALINLTLFLFGLFKIFTAFRFIFLLLFDRYSIFNEQLATSLPLRIRGHCSLRILERRTNVLRKKRIVLRILMEPSGIEPLTSCVQSRRSPS